MLTTSVKVEGLVMTDMQQYHSEPQSSRPVFLDNSDLRSWTTDCTCVVCKQRSINLDTEAESMFENFNGLTTPVNDPQLSDHEYLLCPFEMPAFVFKTRKWGE